MKAIKFYHLPIALCLMIAVLLGSLFFWAFNADYYHEAQQKYEIAAVTGISTSDLDIITDALINYMQRERSNLDLTVEVDGQMEEVFSNREIQHMRDVQDLLKVTLSILLLCAILFCGNSLGWIKRRTWEDVKRTIIGAFALFAIVGATAAIAAVVDFSGTFTLFHKLVFTNDLWMLNPQTDILLQMMPLGFFYDMVLRIIFTALIILASLGALTLIFSRKGKRKYDY